MNPDSGSTPGKPYYLARRDYDGQRLWPRIGKTYEDQARDLLAKGVMVYNGTYKDTGNWTWPELLKIHPKTIEGTKIDYALRILSGPSGAGFPFRCWTWEDRVLTTGSDNVCDSASSIDSHDRLLPIRPGIVAQVCIEARNGNSLRTSRVANDQIKTSSFEYCEDDRMGTPSSDKNRMSWQERRDLSRPSQIP